MERQMIQPLLLQELSTPGIVKKTFDIPYTSKKSLVSNMLLVVFPFCLLVIGADFMYVSPIVNIHSTIELLMKEHLKSSEEKNTVQGIVKVVWLLFGLDVLFLVLFCSVSLLSFVVSNMNIKDLLSKRGGLRMKGVITCLYVTVSVVSVNVFVLILMSLLSNRHRDIVGSLVICIMFLMLGTLCYVHLAAVWIFSMVMSIHELHVNQSMVFDDKIVEGRRIQGFVLMLLSSVFGIAIVVACAFLVRNNDQLFATNLDNGIMMLFYVLMLKLFMFSVGTYKNDEEIVPDWINEALYV